MEVATQQDYKALYEDMKSKYEALLFELIQLKKLIYGSKHERFVGEQNNPSQLALPMEVDAVATAAIASTQQIVYNRTTVDQKPMVHPGRTKLPEHLRREQIVIEPTNIALGSKRIGEEITEELEYIAAELYVNQYIRPKYALQSSEGISTIITIAPMPVRPIEKAIAGPGLLAQVVIDKYVDALPLYRQMQRFERAGVQLPYSTITDWVSATCQLIAPLYEALKVEVLQSGYLHIDETPIKVLDNDKKGKTHRGYFWVYNNSPGKLVFFDYQQGRGERGPEMVLKDYRGYIQSDGYQVYDAFGKREGITLLHCMAHARRYFVEARDNDAVRADYVLERIQELYAIEHRCKGMEPALRQQIRTTEALPILVELGKWIKEQYQHTLPKSPIGKALAYSITRWDKLQLYVTNGMLSIDNNPVENSIRPVAIGRKNYLFCGSHEAAKRTAMLYSLMGTCKQHKVNPFTWLKDVLTRLPSYPIKNVHQLLPHKWNP